MLCTLSKVIRGTMPRVNCLKTMFRLFVLISAKYYLVYTGNYLYVSQLRRVTYYTN
jgi:hypothetical protein